MAARIEEVMDEKLNNKQPEEGEKKQKTIQDAIQELTEKTANKLTFVNQLKEKDIKLQKEINEAQQSYIATRDELYDLQLRFLQAVNQNLSTELSKFKKPASSAPASS